MASRPVQISLEQDLLTRIDKDPEARRRGRSAFIRSAVRLYLAAKDRLGVDEAILRAYRGKSDALLREIEGFLRKQAWPEE